MPQPSGTAKDSEDTMQFSALTGVRPMVGRYPLAKVADAYDQMISGRARSRGADRGLISASGLRGSGLRRKSLNPTSRR